MKFKNVSDVAAWRLCTGCGACAYICPDDRITLVDVLSDGIRPRVKEGDCTNCEDCIKVCPGIETAHRRFDNNGYVLMDLKEGWGPVLEIWEGYAADNEIRYNGSSGGLATALSLYCLEHEAMNGVLHIGSDTDTPWKNKSVFSKSRADLLSRTGSRYSPASPCNKLEHIESSTDQCVFVGKPCDITGMRKAESLRPALHKNIGLAIGIFCAGTPASQGTLDLFKNLNVKDEDVEEVRYRGRGWPGMFNVKLKGENHSSDRMTYMDSWGFIQKYRPYRCHMCPDGTSEFADLSCGDPWYRKIEESESGRSMVLVRTERGREVLRRAMDAGYVQLEKVSHEILVKSQENLLAKRSAVWGRLLAMKAFLIPAPSLRGFSLYDNWRKLPLRQKCRSILGTGRRIMTRRYYRKLDHFGNTKKTHV